MTKEEKRLYMAEYRKRNKERINAQADFSKFVLKEAVLLAKQRTKMLGTEWHVDHIQPVSKGGTSYFTNIQVVPALWNRQKSNRSNSTFWNK